MKDTSFEDLKKIFKDTPRFSIPRYQRSFSWKTDQVEQLLGDLESIELSYNSKRTPIVVVK